MSTNYPDSLDSFSDKTDGTDVVYASHINNMQDALEAIELELGTTPSGSFDDVADAIAAKLNTSGGNLSGDVTCDAGVKLDGVDVGAHTHTGGTGDAPNVPWGSVSGKPTLHNTVISANTTDGVADFIAAGSGLAVDIDGSPTPISMDIDGFNQVITSDTSITSLTASSTCYLYAEKGSGSTPTLGHTTVKPVFSYTAPGSPATDQHWFDLSIRKMKRYTGSAWELKQRIFLGEAITDGSSVTDVISYALNGMFDSGWFAVTANTAYEKKHGIGVLPLDIQLFGATDDDPLSDVHQVTYYFDGADGYGGQVGDINEYEVTINAATNFDYPIFSLGSSDTDGFYRLVVRRGW